MIATTPVARWTWGRDIEGDSKVVACLQDLFTAYAVLRRHHLMVGKPRVSVSLREAGTSNRCLFRGEFNPDVTVPPVDLARQLAAVIEGKARSGELGSVSADAEAAGLVALGDHMAEQERLLRLGASTVLDYVTVRLVTYADVWMPYDLKGRAQPEVHAGNAPRLSEALRDLSEALDSETDPDDATSFGIPSETGVENRFEPDGTASNVWDSFETLTRYREFRHSSLSGVGYQRSASGEVRCLPVRGKHGLLGYLWASDPENAASFEPGDVGDDEVYKAGLMWLERLRSASDRGMSPSAALAELSRLPDEGGAGRVEAENPVLLADLVELRDLAGGR